MEVKVVDILDHVVVAEFEDKKGHLQRKYVSRDILPVHLKDTVLELDEKHLSSAIEYSDVDLVESLGESYPNLPVVELQEAMKRYGLWTRAEYLKHPEKIAYVLRQFPGIDIQTIQKATRRF